jgi:hypothetical protein
MASRTVGILVNGARGSRRRGASECKGCGRKILWCATPAGKAMPFDEAPEVIALNGDVETVSAERVHWYTCEKAADCKRPAPVAPAERRFDGFD